MADRIQARLFLCVGALNGSIASMSRVREETSSAVSFYERRAGEVNAAVNGAIQQKQSFGMGLATLGLFACIALYESLVAKNFPLWTVLLPAPFAGYLFLQSRRLQSKILRLFRLEEYYDAGIARLTRNWEALDEGREFSDPDHFYAADLDLFGKLDEGAVHLGRSTGPAGCRLGTSRPS
jgi:hypothetical protein